MMNKGMRYSARRLNWGNLGIRTALSVVLAAVVGQAAAQSICRGYEYAELMDTPREQLQLMRCQYQADMASMLDAATVDMKAGRLGSSNSALSASNRCAQEADRVERILKTKFQVSDLSCKGAKPPK